MAVKIGINGFGRIGKNVFKIALERGLEVVAIHDLMDTATLAHLLQFDSTQGKFPYRVEHDEKHLIINGKKYFVNRDKVGPKDIDWGANKPDVVVEATGIFTSRESEKGGYGDHLKTGAKKVILTVPSKDTIDATIVLGVNEETLKKEHTCVSNASCTTNSLAPMAKVLNDSFGIESGFITTIHSYTNDQNTLDQPHSDLRRARAAAVSIIPTSTGAAKAIGEVIPELKGKMHGMAMRVPTPTGSVTDLVALLKKEVSVEEVNAAFKKAAEGPMKGILEYEDRPIVSADIVHNPNSSIIDSLLTMQLSTNKKMIKCFSWYDNEWGYSSRVVELAMKLEKFI